MRGEREREREREREKREREKSILEMSSLVGIMTSQGVALAITFPVLLRASADIV